MGTSNNNKSSVVTISYSNGTNKVLNGIIIRSEVEEYNS